MRGDIKTINDYITSTDNYEYFNLVRIKGVEYKVFSYHSHMISKSNVSYVFDLSAFSK